MDLEKIVEHINKMSEKQKTSTIILIAVSILGKLDIDLMKKLVKNILEQDLD